MRFPDSLIPPNSVIDCQSLSWGPIQADRDCFGCHPLSEGLLGLVLVLSCGSTAICFGFCKQLQLLVSEVPLFVCYEMNRCGKHCNHWGEGGIVDAKPLCLLLTA